MKQILAILTFMCFGFIIISCSNEELGMADLKLAFSSYSSTQGSSTGRISEHLEFTQALAGIEKIEIKSDEEGEEDDNEYDFMGSFVIDLLSGSSDPELPVTEIEPGVYNKAEAELAPVIGDTASVVIQGIYGDVPFTFLWENTEDFKAESDQGFELTADILNNLLIEVDLHSMFEGVDFGQAGLNEDGAIILSKDINRDLADIVEANIEAASEIGLDENTDGEIDE